jgi:hypothetical protein
VRALGLAELAVAGKKLIGGGEEKLGGAGADERAVEEAVDAKEATGLVGKAVVVGGKAVEVGLGDGETDRWVEEVEVEE